MTAYLYDDGDLDEVPLPPDGRLMYRVREAAEMLGIGRTNVYELMTRGGFAPSVLVIAG